jgi:TolB-like protein/DNA-binding winged helix-turn-helix (wHTH) protein/tetratricopeptide (TPR) repeat protein
LTDIQGRNPERGEAPERLIAGPFLMDWRDARVWRDGVPVRLGGKALALLQRLVQTPEVLVSKDALFEAVWPGLAVSDSVLTTAVKELRQALGDDARKPWIIETAHGRGYRFLLPVTPQGVVVPEPQVAAVPPPTGQAPARRRVAWGFVVLAAALVLIAVVAAVLLRPTLLGPHPKSVAVLPFAELSADPNDQWFADGFTEEVLSTLARTPDLRVASRLPVGQDPAAVARSQAVAHVLTGSVRRAGDRVRVTVDLIRTSDGAHVWSQSYDRRGGDVISIQEDVGLHIAQALKTVTDGAKLRAMSAAGTRSVEAYEAYLRGLALTRRQLNEGDVAYAKAAADAYEEARRIDPRFAAAHWRSAMTWFGNATRIDSASAGQGLSDKARLAGFFERVDAAIATSQDQTETLKYRAVRAVMQLHVREARRLMGDYLTARPRDAEAWEEMAQLSAYAGDRRGLVEAARRFEDLTLDSGQPRSRAITLLVMGGRYGEAASLSRKLVRLAPDSVLTLYQAQRAEVMAGHRTESRRLLDRLQTSTLPADNKRLAALRQACADRRLGDAGRIYAELAAGPKFSNRFHAAQLVGDEAAATAALAPLDTPDRLPTLMQFMIYPTFDARAFPRLHAALVADGVTPPPPASLPYACPAG